MLYYKGTYILSYTTIMGLRTDTFQSVSIIRTVLRYFQVRRFTVKVYNSIERVNVAYCHIAFIVLRVRRTCTLNPFYFERAVGDFLVIADHCSLKPTIERCYYNIMCTYNMNTKFFILFII